MTKPRAPQSAVEAPPAPNGSEPTQTAEERRVLELLSEIRAGGGGFTVRLERREHRDRGEWQHLAVIDATPDLHEDVRLKFGGGSYRGRVYNPNRDYVGHATFSVAGMPKSDAVETRAETAIPDVVARMEQFFERVMERLSAPRETDPIATALRILEVMRPSQPALLASAPNDLDDSRLAKMLRKERKEGIELGQKLAGVQPELGVAGVVAAAVPELLNVMGRDVTLRENAARRANQLHQHALPAQPSVVQAAPPAPPAAPAAYPPGYEWLGTLRVYLPQLQRLAAAGKDPNLYAALTLDQAPNALQLQIEAAANLPDFVATVVGAVPEMQSWPAWWQSFVEAVYEQAGPDDDESEGES